MPLTPNDIHNKTFTKSFRGYDEDEVNEFLAQVRKDYEIVLRKKTELEAKVNELDERIGHFANIEETLNKSILVAQEAAEDVKRLQFKIRFFRSEVLWIQNRPFSFRSVIAAGKSKPDVCLSGNSREDDLLSGI